MIYCEYQGSWLVLGHISMIQIFPTSNSDMNALLVLNHSRDSGVPNRNYRGQSLAAIYQTTLGVRNLLSSPYGKILKLNTQVGISYRSLITLILSFSKPSGYFQAEVQSVCLQMFK